VEYVGFAGLAPLAVMSGSADFKRPQYDGYAGRFKVGVENVPERDDLRGIADGRDSCFLFRVRSVPVVSQLNGFRV
jgi:hypothetical protein